MSAIAQLMLAGAPSPPSIWNWAGYWPGVYDEITFADISENGQKIIATSPSGWSSAGVYISLDGGQSWINRKTNIPSYFLYTITGCAVSGDGSCFVLSYDYVWGGGGYMLSTDNGVTWSIVSVGLQTSGIDLSRNGAVMAMACPYVGGYAGGVVVSTNYGASYTIYHQYNNWKFVRLAADGLTGFGAINPGEGGLGKIGKTTNSFQDINNIQGNIAAGSDCSWIDVSSDGQQVLAGIYGSASYLRYSTDSGQTFNSITTPVTDSAWRPGISGDGKIFGISGANWPYGTYFSNNFGASWLQQVNLNSEFGRIRFSANGRRVAMVTPGAPVAYNAYVWYGTSTN